MKTKLAIKLIMLFTLILSSGCFSSQQFKNPLYTTTMIAGIFSAALLEKDEFNKSVIVFAKSQPMPLCKAWQLQKITHDLIANQCLPISGNNIENCQEIFGCMSVRVDKSVKEDTYLWEKLLVTIKSPCITLTQDYVRRNKFNILPYNTETLEDNFNCKNTQKLPYTKVIITYGDEYNILNF